jgi:N-acetyl-gamma-glutamyl-phosphate reductase
VITASIIGASGYSGVELLKILTRHPNVRVGRLCAATSAGQQLAGLHPWFARQIDRPLEAYHPEAVAGSDVVFVALPSGEAMKIVPELIGQGNRVIDLGGDFRLNDPLLYERFYGHAHTAAAFLPESLYAFPEWHASALATARLVANPGCYPTSVVLALAPLLAQGVIEASSISITSMSGVSGAGRKGTLDLSFCETNETVKAYRVGEHQHIPEIRMALNELAGVNASFTFVPHLVPLTRGIYTTTTATLAPNVDEQDVCNAFSGTYADAPFVRCSASAIPEIRHVVHTNFIDIGFRVIAEENRLVIMSAIDNLIKGAAGQAVQNMNIMFGFNEMEGLL